MIETVFSAVVGNPAVIAAIVLAFAAGMVVPFYFALERMRGFGRALASKLPYKPPPGVEEGQAMEQATDEPGDE
ncbi:hypothetical protein EXE43_09615 [Halorubrum sp. SS5]|nr:hypothetical protein EXE43_09615 [Halorubrum sp. SS5]